MRSSVAGLLRPDSPTRGPPFVPRRINRVFFRCWPNTLVSNRRQPTANPAELSKNSRRLWFIGAPVVSACEAAASVKPGASAPGPVVFLSPSPHQRAKDLRILGCRPFHGLIRRSRNVPGADAPGFRPTPASQAKRYCSERVLFPHGLAVHSENPIKETHDRSVYSYLIRKTHEVMCVIGNNQF